MTASDNRSQPTPGWFDAHQRRTVEAAMARIIPTDDTPGAAEVGTIDFLDRYLSGIEFVRAKPDGSGFVRLQGRTADAWQARLDMLRSTYDAGCADLDRRGRTRFGSDFAELTPVQQDDVLSDLTVAVRDQRVEPSGEGRKEPPALQQTSTEVDLDFLPLLALHTRQGFYSDPVYGGNRDHVGWQVIGFPGPASLGEVHAGRYSTLAYFAEDVSAPQEPEKTDDHP